MLSPLYSLSALELPSAPFPLISVDTETCRIKEAAYDIRRKTRISPPDTPALVLGSITSSGVSCVYRSHEFLEVLASLLRGGSHFVFHNLAFDHHVIHRASGEVGQLLNAAVGAGRVHDTALLEILISIARGSVTVKDRGPLRMSRLEDLARKRAGMILSKDPLIRLGYDAFVDPATEIPEAFLHYAALDAEATYRVFCSQWKEAEIYARTPLDCPYPVLPDCRRDYGLLTDTLQARGAVAFAWLERFPLRVDQPAVVAMANNARDERALLEEALISFGWAKRTPKSKKFSTSHTTLRRLLRDFARLKGLAVPATPTGKLSLAYDFWAQHIPRLSPELARDPTGACGLENQAGVWMRYCRVQKLLSTYLDTYSSSDSHYPSYYTLGARTGRVATLRPNATNIPKRKDGIRGLFVPARGCKLIESDWKAAELVALAETYHLMYGGSPLETELNAGRDPHTATAIALVGADNHARMTPAEKDKFRFAAKAVNFGLPGGLGAENFRKYVLNYKVRLTLQEAREIRSKALENDPALRSYLQDSGTPESRLKLAAENLGMGFSRLVTALQAWRHEESDEVHWRLALSRLRGWSNGSDEWPIPAPSGFHRKFDLFRSTAVSPAGFVRGRASYTEAHNLPFQSLVACALKLALWNLYTAWYPECGWRPVAAIHDAILLEADEDTVSDAQEIVQEAMIYGLKAVCPHIAVVAEPSAPLDRWGKSTDAFGAPL